MPGKHEGWQGVFWRAGMLQCTSCSTDAKFAACCCVCLVSQPCAAFPAEPWGCPRSFAVGTGWAAASLRGVAGSQSVPVYGGRGLSRAGLRRAKPFCLQPSPSSWPHVTSPVLVAKWCFLRRPRELQERGAGQCCACPRVPSLRAGELI